MTDSELIPKTREQLIYGGEYAANVAITDRLDPDEKVYLLIEVNRIDTTSRHVRRWEFIYVQRDGELAVVGLAASFHPHVECRQRLVGDDARHHEPKHRARRPAS